MSNRLDVINIMTGIEFEEDENSFVEDQKIEVFKSHRIFPFKQNWAVATYVQGDEVNRIVYNNFYDAVNWMVNECKKKGKGLWKKS